MGINAFKLFLISLYYLLWSWSCYWLESCFSSDFSHFID